MKPIANSPSMVSTLMSILNCNEPAHFKREMVVYRVSTDQVGILEYDKVLKSNWFYVVEPDGMRCSTPSPDINDLVIMGKL